MLRNSIIQHMKRLVLCAVFFTIANAVNAQFADTAALNIYIRDTIKDRRPEKINAAQLSKALLGLSKFLGGKTDSNYIKTTVRDSSKARNGLEKTAGNIELGGKLTKEVYIYDSTAGHYFTLANRSGYFNTYNKDGGGYMQISPYGLYFGYYFKNQSNVENILGVRAIGYNKSLDFGLNGSGIRIDSLKKLQFHGYPNNVASDSLLTTDESGNVKLKAPTGIVAGENFLITNDTIDGQPVKVLSATGGGGSGDSTWLSATVGQHGQLVGTILNESFPGTSIPATFTETTPDATVSFNDKIIVAGGNNTTANFLQTVSHYNYDKQKISINVVPQDRTSTSYGIGLVQSQNAINYNTSIDVRWNFTSGVDSGRCSFNGQYSSPALYFIASDTLLCEYERDGWQQTVSMLNKRTGKKTRISAQDLNIGSGGKLKLVFYGGSQHITNVKIESFNLKNDGVAIIGDSQGNGNGASIEANTWVNQIFGKNKYRYSNYSHPSICTDYWLVSDWPNLKVQNPKYAIFAIGYNDARDLGDDSTAYKARVVPVLDSLALYNIKVIIVNIIPTSNESANPTLRSSQMLQNLATTRGLKFINVRTSLLNGGSNLYGPYNYDGVHLSDSGNIVYASAVKSLFNDAYDLYVSDSASHTKLHNLPSGDEGMNLLAVNSKGDVYQVPNVLSPNALRNIIKNNFSSLGGLNAQPNSEVHTSGPVISDSSLRVKNSQGLKIGFNNDNNTDASGANIDITNAGAAGVGFPQAFDDMTGAGNIKIVASYGSLLKQSMTGTISGNRNTLINAHTTSTLSGSSNIGIGNTKWSGTTGSENIGIGLESLRGITTGSNNIHLVSRNVAAASFPSSLTESVIIGSFPQFTTPSNHDIFFASGNDNFDQTYHFGDGGSDNTYFQVSPMWVSSNRAGGNFYFRGGAGRGTGTPGSLIFQTYNTAASGTTLQSGLTTQLTIASGKVSVAAKLNIGSVTDYADNAAALSGGLVAGDVYRTGDLLKIVH